jgi:2-keto-3-deoxy-L-rhamnonate aldolase RhmA
MSVRGLELKQRLARGHTTFGAWLSLSNPNVAESMAGTGYDLVLIDAEHGPFGLEGLQVALMAFKGSPSVPIVRVAWNDPVRIKQVLDLGADGILVPMVNSASEALAAVAACKYPPEGVRGFGPKRAADYGRDTDRYTARANASLITIVQIEHVDAVAGIDEILAVPGIDVICIGLTDRSGSAGVLRQLAHPVVQRAPETIVARSRARSLPVCMGVVFEPDEMARWAAKGATFVLTGEGTSLLRTAATHALEQTRAAVTTARGPGPTAKR